MRSNKRLAILLTMAMLITMIPLPVFASEANMFSDLPENWSKGALINAVSNGLLKGDGEMIRPDENLTRAQMAAVINRAFGVREKSSLNDYSDVLSSSWYYDDMAKAVHMRTFVGSGDGMLQPEKFITREEAFAVLARAFKVNGASEKALDSFWDKQSLSTWALEDAAALVEAGYISGSDGMLNPKQNITRAEFAQMMDNLVKQYIKEAGTYTEIKTGNVMINAPGVTLKNLLISGDLIIGDGVGDGNVTLDNVVVTGRMVVRGGGSNSIVIKGNSSIETIIVARVDGKVRISSEDGTIIGTVIADGLDDVIIEGNYKFVIILADNITVTATNSSIDNAQIDGNNSILIINENSFAESVTVNGNGAVITGEGSVDEVLVYGNKVSVETINTSVTAAKDAEDVLALGKTVTPGTTVFTRIERAKRRSSETPVVETVSNVTIITNPVDVSFLKNDASVLATLTTSTEDADIYYTLKGVNTTSSSILYSGPFEIKTTNSNGETIKLEAVGIKTGYNNSEISQITIVFNGLMDAYSFKTTYAAILALTIETVTISDEDDVEAALTAYDSLSTEVKSSLSEEKTLLDNLALKIDELKQAIISDFAGGSGTLVDPYQVETAKQLDKVREYLDKYFIQIADINLTDYLDEGGDGYNSGEGWVPIGEFTPDKRFSGGYDGDGFNIDNLTIDRNEMYQGLFGYVSNAAIKNVNLRNVDITGSTWTAGLVAFQDGGQIINSSSEGIVRGVGNHGGLVAQSNGVTNSALIEGCSTDGQVLTLNKTANPYYTGGLVGRTNGAVVSKSYSTTIVEGANTVGGLVGLSFNSTVEECYATGNISGNEVIGGIAGEATGTISDVYYYGTIDGYNYIGGLVGKYSGLTIENAYCIAENSENVYNPYHHYFGLYSSSIDSSEIYNASLYDNDYAGFYERTIDSLKKLYSYNNLDFQNIWGHNIDENNGYPFLRWQGYEHIPDFAGGSGTETDPYKVATAEQLNKVRYYPKAYFLQTADINLTDYLDEGGDGYNSGEGWVPIGTSSKPFSGSYDGDDFSISGLFINSLNANYQGLFGYVISGSRLSNINLIGTSIYAHDYIGALAGYSEAEITGCTAVSVAISCEDMYAGGLVGQNSGTITNCSATGTVKVDYEYAGGLVGYNYSNSSSGYVGYIGDSFSEAEVTYLNADEYELEGAGGLVGYNSGGTIEYSHATGNVTGNEAVGGLIGENWQGTVTGCYATGNVSSISDYEGYRGYYAGGLIGENTYMSSVVDCYAEGNVTGHEEVGGLIGYNSALIQKCFAVGNVSGVVQIGGLAGQSSGTIENSYATGSAAGGQYVGGLVGYLDYSYGTISNSYAAGLVSTASADRGGLHGGSIRADSVFNCYYDKITTGQNDTGKGVPLTTEEMTDQYSFSGWNFENESGIWKIDYNPASYPYFQWQEANIPLAPIERATLLGHWAFDEGTGIAASDSSENNNDGTLQGATWTSDRESSENKALEFGVDKWVDIPDTIKPEKITLSAWVYITGTDGSAAPIFSAEKGAGATDFAYRMQITSDARLRMEAIGPYTTGSARVSTSPDPLNLNQWYHVAGTYDGVKTKIYINGNLVKSDDHGTVASLKRNSSIPVAIGHLQGWTVQWFRGKIDDARIYDGALSQSEIQDLVGINE